MVSVMILTQIHHQFIIKKQSYDECEKSFHRRFTLPALSKTGFHFNRIGCSHSQKTKLSKSLAQHQNMKKYQANYVRQRNRCLPNLGNSCKGVCIHYKHTSLHNGLKYSAGIKRCTYCQIFMVTDGNRCPCCSTKLRTRSRNKKYSS